MELDIEKFINSANTDDKTTLDSFVGNIVTHGTFGIGEIVKVETRDIEDGPIFRIQFGDSVKEFNLDSFRERYIEKIDVPPTRRPGEAPPPATPIETRAASNAF